MMTFLHIFWESISNVRGLNMLRFFKNLAYNLFNIINPSSFTKVIFAEQMLQAFKKIIFLIVVSPSINGDNGAGSIKGTGDTKTHQS